MPGTPANHPIDIIDTAKSDAVFKTLIQCFQTAELVDYLKGAGPFTVFAPNDAAFEKLPQGRLQELLKPENRSSLKNLLRYHISNGRCSDADLETRAQLDTVNDGVLTVRSDADGIRINDASIRGPELLCSNGIIHVLDAVLVSP